MYIFDTRIFTVPEPVCDDVVTSTVEEALTAAAAAIFFSRLSRSILSRLSCSSRAVTTHHHTYKP